MELNIVLLVWSFRFPIMYARCFLYTYLSILFRYTPQGLFYFMVYDGVCYLFCTKSIPF
jgi:hypothetical protein